MSKEFHDLEDSLRKYIMDEQKVSNAASYQLMHKYNNLTMSMHPSKEGRPHLFIKLGISEACFDIESGKIFNGGLGSDTRLVRNWIIRNIPRGVFKDLWKENNKVEQLDLSDNQ